MGGEMKRALLLVFIFAATQAGAQTNIATWGVTHTALTAGTPTFSPGAGAVANPTTITISSPTSACNSYIHHNTTGSPVSGDPTGTYSVTGAVTLYGAVIGCPGYSDSAVGSAPYTISASAPALVGGCVASGDPATCTVTATTAGSRVCTFSFGPTMGTPAISGQTFTAVEDNNAVSPVSYNNLISCSDPLATPGDKVVSIAGSGSGVVMVALEFSNFTAVDDHHGVYDQWGNAAFPTLTTTGSTDLLVMVSLQAASLPIGTPSWTNSFIEFAAGTDLTKGGTTASLASQPAGTYSSTLTHASPDRQVLFSLAIK